MKCIHQYQPIKYMHLEVTFYITLRPTQACLLIAQNDSTISWNMWEGSCRDGIYYAKGSYFREIFGFMQGGGGGGGGGLALTPPFLAADIFLQFTY